MQFGLLCELKSASGKDKGRCMPRLCKSSWSIVVLGLATIFASTTTPLAARAVTKPHAAVTKSVKKSAPVMPAATKDAAIVVDGASGRVLYSRNADAQRRPASLTKMMTLYLLFGELEEGNLTLDAKLTASVH